MNKQSIIIYDFKILFNILFEIKEELKFDLYNFQNLVDLSDLSEKNYGNYLIVSKSSEVIKNNPNLYLLDELPVKVEKLVEKLNIKLLKKKYNNQSEIKIIDYTLNLNSRVIYKKNVSTKLTEREIDIILFLHKKEKPKKITILQKEVWGHNSNLETHTVETHIYRLRKKMKDIFEDDNFISSHVDGYFIL